jgi:hypothetical protein|tara:strand:- start:6886 stop:7143 length:258 start_codon:yes stop_codon:yes gene_type:complete
MKKFHPVPFKKLDVFISAFSYPFVQPISLHSARLYYGKRASLEVLDPSVVLIPSLHLPDRCAFGCISFFHKKQISPLFRIGKPAS